MSLLIHEQIHRWFYKLHFVSFILRSIFGARMSSVYEMNTVGWNEFLCEFISPHTQQPMRFDKQLL